MINPENLFVAEDRIARWQAESVAGIRCREALHRAKSGRRSTWIAALYNCAQAFAMRSFKLSWRAR